MSSWKTTQEYPNPTLGWVAMSKDRSECSVAESSRKIFFIIFNSYLQTSPNKQRMFFSTQAARWWLWCREEHSLRQSFISIFLKQICKKQHVKKKVLSLFCTVDNQIFDPRGTGLRGTKRQERPRDCLQYTAGGWGHGLSCRLPASLLSSPEHISTNIIKTSSWS